MAARFVRKGNSLFLEIQEDERKRLGLNESAEYEFGRATEGVFVIAEKRAAFTEKGVSAAEKIHLQAEIQ